MPKPISNRVILWQAEKVGELVALYFKPFDLFAQLVKPRTQLCKFLASKVLKLVAISFYFCLPFTYSPHTLSKRFIDFHT